MCVRLSRETQSDSKVALMTLMDEATRVLSDNNCDNTAPFLAQLLQLKDRLDAEKFHLAVLGQFKRGKSTLLNALLGADLLPASAIPLTAIPTVIQWSDHRQATVHYKSGRTESQYFDSDCSLKEYIAIFVTEKGNPRNHLGVSRVEVFYPAKLLLEGVTLIDTPGIGSTLVHNTDTTLEYLGQCDAALFVVSADPPITADEVEFLRIVECHVKKIFVILNKVDYLSSADQRAVTEFVFEVLQQRSGLKAPEKIYGISARQALEGRTEQDGHKWSGSGVVELESDLRYFFRHEKSDVLVAAVRSKFAGILRETSMSLKLTIKALEMPTMELANRQKRLEDRLVEIERQQMIAGDLLSGDKKRTLDFLEAQAISMRQNASAFLRNIVDESVELEHTPELEMQTHLLIAEAIPSFFTVELENMAKTFGEYVATVLEPHQQKADELVTSVREIAAQIFDLDFQADPDADIFHMQRLPYWVKDEWRTKFGEIPDGWVDKLLPASLRKKRLRKRLNQRVDALVTRNVENLRWATLQNVEQAFLSFGESMKRRLADTVAGTRNAINAAVSMRDGQQDKLFATLSLYQSVVEALAGMLERLNVREQSR